MTDSNASVDEQNSTEQTSKSPAKNALEWSVFALSLTLILATLGFLGLQSKQLTGSPPRLEVTLGEPVRAGENVLIPVKVENRGATTAESVEVEVRHGAQTSQFSLGFVPRRGERSGWVSFRAPVRKSALKTRVLGYEQS